MRKPVDALARTRQRIETLEYGVIGVFFCIIVAYAMAIAPLRHW